MLLSDATERYKVNQDSVPSEENLALVGEERLSPVRPDLRHHCLSYLEVLAQSIAVIAPSTVPAAILGLIFAVAGKGTWLSFLLGMIGLVFVSFNINQFAQRSASPGSLYTYVVRGLGPTAGVLAGWALLFGYMVTGMSTLCGFGIIGGVLLGQIGIHAPILLLFAVCTVGSFCIAYKDIQLSAQMMLLFEGASLLAMLILGVLIWKYKGFAIDTTQLRFKGTTPGGVLMGIVLVVFGFSGFESSTSLGDEAKNPLRTIPRSVIQSVVVTGLIFIFMAYVIILGFEGSSAALDKTEAPLDFLAHTMGLGFLGTLISIGVLLSFFSCTLACINSTARIIFSMSRHGLFLDALGEAHEKNKTPYIAVGLSALITFLIPASLYSSGVSAFDGQGYFGTLCTFGFLVVYILISIAAPLYLKAIGKLNKTALLYAVSGTGFMILPVLGMIGIPGSALFPPPAYPSDLLVWLFLAYMAIGLVWLRFQSVRYPKMIPDMRGEIENVELQFAKAETVRETSVS
jgi:amino acid transporter